MLKFGDMPQQYVIHVLQAKTGRIGKALPMLVEVRGYRAYDGRSEIRPNPPNRLANVSPPTHASRDVRMKGFAQRTTVADAINWLDKQLEPLDSHSVPLEQASGRVLANDVTSGVDVPGFDRAMMDGYAVVAADTQGASAYNPLRLEVVGEVLPGQTPEIFIEPGKALRIMTGAAMPQGADAVLPAEQTETDSDAADFVIVHGEVTPHKHVGRRGEDIVQGEVVFREGRVLRPQDVGVLSSVGLSDVTVVKSPRVRIVVTGNELLPAGSKPRGMQIVDSNSPMLRALVARDGGDAEYPGIVPDDPEAIREALLGDVDVVLASGGSSVGKEDFVPQLLAEEGELAVHGIAMRPSSPTGMGRLDERLVFLLPGNPVSCLCAYDFFAGRAIRALGGRPRRWPYRKSTARLARKIVSQIGRFDYCRVKIEDEAVEPLAISGASVLSSTTRADGFVVVPDDSEGYPEGQCVDVYMYDATGAV